MNTLQFHMSVFLTDNIMRISDISCQICFHCFSSSFDHHIPRKIAPQFWHLLTEMWNIMHAVLLLSNVIREQKKIFPSLLSGKISSSFDQVAKMFDKEKGRKYLIQHFRAKM